MQPDNKDYIKILLHPLHDQEDNRKTYSYLSYYLNLFKCRDEVPELANMDVDKARFPLCITWTPLPLITWIIPSIGHVGICHSDGKIHDFAGPYFVS